MDFLEKKEKRKKVHVQHVYQQVLWFDVSVDYVHTVQILQSFS